MKKYLLTSLTFLTALTGCINATNSYEGPKYTVVEKVESKGNNFEIRQYNPYLVAEVTTSGSEKEASNKAFRKLADFIFGNNTVKKDIAMTAPVEIVTAEKFVSADSAKIAMTAPVEIENKSSSNKDSQVMIMRFSMPNNYTLENLPKPNNDEVKIYEMAGYKAAVSKFSGLFGEEKYQTKKADLEYFIAGKNLTPASEPIKAYYNPPFTIPFLRTNEIIIKVK